MQGMVSIGAQAGYESPYESRKKNYDQGNLTQASLEQVTGYALMFE